jgi:hypothetical protein
LAGYRNPWKMPDYYVICFLNMCREKSINSLIIKEIACYCIDGQINAFFQ